MQRVAGWCVLVCLAAMNFACADQAHLDRTQSEVEAVRRESAMRDAQLRALEQQQAAVAQQMTLLTTIMQSTLGQRGSNDDEHALKFAELSSQLAGLSLMVRTWREEERPPSLDPAARRVAEQGSSQERAEAVRKVQALIDAGHVKLTVQNGRTQLALLRPIDSTNPYQPPAPKPPVVPAKPPPLKRAPDSLGF